ncbi:MAG: aminomethyl-transferring glycine dehydrogenase subunit GcvPA [Leptolinea sp.]|nr:aminomethyl-transferring glycine dehydrogenase subunit GcvPA [Leptolinea sp.]
MFTPHTNSERDEMLRAVGVRSIDDLFKAVPEKYRYPELDLPAKRTEMEITAEMGDLSAGNGSVKEMMCFLGAGAYNHYIPSAVDAIISRGEFFTAYTPYQPEISQGTLQAIFEYQSLIANLTGMDACNASHYDGATSAAEAVVLAYAHFRGKRSKIVLSPALHPHYRETIRTYTQGYSDISILGDQGSDPLESPDKLISLIDYETAVVIVQYPDFFGRIIDYTKVGEAAHQNGALFAVSINPTALGLLKPPSEFGADIVIGEGQPLGIPLSLGGPYLGLFATKKELIRKISGRLVGETVDQDGKRGYVLTLTAREQHIRREKATSNICSNQGLIALASSVYLSLLGKHGLKQVAELCYQKAHYAAQQISSVRGFSVIKDAPFFHEFMVKCPFTVDEINAHLMEHGILGGFNLESEYPSMKNTMLVAVTEVLTKEDIDIFVDVLKEMSND